LCSFESDNNIIICTSNSGFTYNFSKEHRALNENGCTGCEYCKHKRGNIGGCCPKPPGHYPPLVCCHNIDSGEKKFPGKLAELSNDCKVLSTILHELVHFGCSRSAHQSDPKTNEVYPGGYLGWEEFMECICPFLDDIWA
jgi:hypothetical protein